MRLCSSVILITYQINGGILCRRDKLQISVIEGVRDKLEVSKVFNGSETFDTWQLSANDAIEKSRAR